MCVCVGAGKSGQGAGKSGQGAGKVDREQDREQNLLVLDRIYSSSD